MKRTVLASVFAFAMVAVAAPRQQPDKGFEEPLADRVRHAIDGGIRYLRASQDANTGSWETVSTENVLNYPGGQSALVLLALLNAGVPVDDPVIVKGLKYIRKVDDPQVYVCSLQTMVLAQAGQSQDLERIQKNVDHLMAISVKDSKNEVVGWAYGRGAADIQVDYSNTQFALLALWSARQSGAVKISAAFWEQVSRALTRAQKADGGWAYQLDSSFLGMKDSSLTMTAAGLSGLLMAQMELNAGQEKLDPVAICGQYEENVPLGKGINWISKPPSTVGSGVDNFRIQILGKTFYNLYGIERLGRLSGMRFIGSHDWYREGCRWLVEHQDKRPGSWSQSTSYDSLPVISTSFALLFLAKGRTPILVSKLAHGTGNSRQENDQDWNRRRNDLRHLVDFASTSVFKKMPMGWQTFDIVRALQPQPGAARVTDSEVTSDLLQSPIVYITGHQSPERRLLQREKDILRRYVENGGFIMAVACCATPDFDKGFRELCEQLFPDNEEKLTPLPADHPIWNMRFEVKPGSFGLQGIQMGCKTVLVYSPQNLCGYWEINRLNDGAEGTTAFRLGANIIAYATGLEPPKPRLTTSEVRVPLKDSPLLTAPRGYLQVGQLISSVGEQAEWKPAPEAMGRLMQYLRLTVGLDVVLKTANVPIDHNDLVNYKFLYMHGRKDFNFSAKKLETLRFNLKNGGMLLADACCGKEDFDKGFRRFVGDLFPADAFPAGEAPRLVPIPPTDELFGEKLNGKALTDANIQARVQRGAAPRHIAPSLEGVKIGDRWVVIYSKYDIGCALEKSQAADCVGYTYDSALLIARAAVLYQFDPK